MTVDLLRFTEEWLLMKTHGKLKKKTFSTPRIHWVLFCFRLFAWFHAIEKSSENTQFILDKYIIQNWLPKNWSWIIATLHFHDDVVVVIAGFVCFSVGDGYFRELNLHNWKIWVSYVLAAHGWNKLKNECKTVSLLSKTVFKSFWLTAK